MLLVSPGEAGSRVAAQCESVINRLQSSDIIPFSHPAGTNETERRSRNEGERVVVLAQLPYGIEPTCR